MTIKVAFWYLNITGSMYIHMFVLYFYISLPLRFFNVKQYYMCMCINVDYFHNFHFMPMATFLKTLLPLYVLYMYIPLWMLWFASITSLSFLLKYSCSSTFKKEVHLRKVCLNFGEGAKFKFTILFLSKILSYYLVHK